MEKKKYIEMFGSFTEPFNCNFDSVSGLFFHLNALEDDEGWVLFNQPISRKVIL